MQVTGQKILVVEDEPFAASLIKRQLEDFGYTNMVIAEDGSAALDAVRHDSFAAILLDMKMPGMSGAEVLKALKSDLELHDVPVIVVSGDQDMDLIVECIELGAEDYLDKPVNAKLLGARLRNVLERQRLRRYEVSSMEQLKSEKRRADSLLQAILPPAALHELTATGTVRARRYDNIAILFCDVSGFTQFCSDRAPEEIVEQLEALFGRFEKVVPHFGMEKIKTIGDAFMAVTSLNTPHSDPLYSAVSCGLEMMDATKHVCPGWETRVGVAMGPVVAGIVGREKFQFDVWGDTVNIAARMVAVGRCGAVTMPQDCWERSDGDYVGKLLGEIEVKGKGPMRIVECTELKQSIRN